LKGKSQRKGLYPETGQDGKAVEQAKMKALRNEVSRARIVCGAFNVGELDLTLGVDFLMPLERMRNAALISALRSLTRWAASPWLPRKGIWFTCRARRVMDRDGNTPS